MDTKADRKNSADNESQKNALIMYYDYKFALEGIIEIMKVQLQEHLAIIAGLNEKTKEEQNESCNLI